MNVLHERQREVDRVAPDQAGVVLLEVKFSRLRATILTLVGVGLVGATLALVLAADRSSWGVGEWLFVTMGTLLGSLIMIASVRQVLSPITMITATDRGLLLHLDGSRYVEAGCLIQWRDIEDLSLDIVSGWQGGDRRRFKTIVLSLRPAAPVIPRSANYGPLGPGRSIRVDASNGTLRGEDLLDSLEEIRRQHR